MTINRTSSRIASVAALALAVVLSALAFASTASAANVTITNPANGSVVDSIPPLATVPPVSFTLPYVGWLSTPSCDYTGGLLLPGSALCDSNLLERPSTDGIYTLAISGTITDGFTPIGDSDTSTFTLDTFDPVAAISSPADSVQTNNKRPAFTFSATDANPLTYTCRIDGIDYACSSPTSFTPGLDVPDGTHSFQVIASDGANTGGATIFFTVDTIAPTVNVSFPTAGVVVDSSVPEVQLTSDGATAGSLCRFDAAEFQNCSGATWLGGSLSDGSHTLTVRATDLAGNVKEVVVQFFVDDSLSSGPLPKSVALTSSKASKVKRGKFSVKTGIAILPKDPEFIDRACTGSTTFAIKPKGGKSYGARVKLKRSGDRCVASGKVTLPAKFKRKRATLTVRYHGSMLISSFIRKRSIKKL